MKYQISTGKAKSLVSSCWHSLVENFCAGLIFYTPDPIAFHWDTILFSTAVAKLRAMINAKRLLNEHRKLRNDVISLRLKLHEKKKKTRERQIAGGKLKNISCCSGKRSSHVQSHVNMMFKNINTVIRLIVPCANWPSLNLFFFNSFLVES